MTDVTLRVSRREQQGRRWYSTESTTGKKYWYRFQGGDDGAGNQTYDSTGAETFIVKIVGRNATRFRFNAPFYTFNDPNNELSGHLGDDPQTYIVRDECALPCGNMLYGFYVSPASDPSDMFLCHPRISNRW